MNKDETISKGKILVGYCTVPNMYMAQDIANMLTHKKLVACVNIVPNIISIYRWQDTIHESEELMLIMKTRPELEEILIQTIKSLHSYEVPEIIFTEFKGGNTDYIKWVYKETKTAEKTDL